MSNILTTEFESIIADITALYDKKGMRASGKAIESLEAVQDSPLNVKLYGASYFTQLEFGRNSGGFPPLESIKQWILDKGVFAQALATMKISTLAFLIARKIAREGWNREKYGGVNLISDVITAQRMQDIINKVGFEQMIIFSESITKKIKEVFV